MDDFDRLVLSYAVVLLMAATAGVVMFGMGPQTALLAAACGALAALVVPLRSGPDRSAEGPRNTDLLAVLGTLQLAGTLALLARGIELPLAFLLGGLGAFAVFGALFLILRLKRRRHLRAQ